MTAHVEEEAARGTQARDGKRRQARRATLRTVGHNVARAEGVEKVTGAARYIDDLVFPGMLYGAHHPLDDSRRAHRRRRARSGVRLERLHLRRSPRHRRAGQERRRHDRRGSAVPRRRSRAAPGRADRAPRARRSRAPRRRAGARARSLRGGAPRSSTSKRRRRCSRRSRFAAATSTPVFARRGVTVVEGDIPHRRAGAALHRAQRRHRACPAPPIPTTAASPCYGSMQCPYYVHARADARCSACRANKVRVVQTETGGGFGGKEEYPSMIAGHAALLARKAGRPVKMIYDRARGHGRDDQAPPVDRPPSHRRRRNDGTHPRAWTSTCVSTAAPTSTLSPVVLSRGVHPRHRARIAASTCASAAASMMTNTPPNGAFRGFGAPQTQFAAEVHMDRIADALGIDPVALREINALRPGDTTATGQTLEGLGRARTRCSTRAGASRARRRSHSKKRARNDGARDEHAIAASALALFFHGSGFTGGGEVKLASTRGSRSPRRACASSSARTEIGQGTRTMHAQIVAETLGIPYDCIEVARPRHRARARQRPDGRVAHLHGRRQASCSAAREEMRARARRLRRRQSFASARAGCSPSAAPSRSSRSTRSRARSCGTTTPTRATPTAPTRWGCNVAEVEVDPDHLSRRAASQFTAVHEIGKAIHPILADGQIEGGTRAGDRLGAATKTSSCATAGWRTRSSPTTSSRRRSTRRAIDVVIAREPVRARPVRRQGRRRDADGRPGAGGRQRDLRHDRRATRRDPGDAGADHERARSPTRRRA